MNIRQQRGFEWYPHRRVLLPKMRKFCGRQSQFKIILIELQDRYRLAQRKLRHWVQAS